MQSQLLSLLARHLPHDEIERGHLARVREFVGRTPRCASRSTLEGHVTASAWVLCPAGRSALLTHHRKLGRWLQPGGHLEERDRTIHEAALREAREESGIHDIVLLSDALFDVDVHRIPARKEEPEHWHYDLRFLLQARRRDFAVGEESIDLAWVDLGSIVDADESIMRMVRKTAGRIEEN